MLHMSPACKNNCCRNSKAYIREVHPFFRDAVTYGLDGCAATPSSYEALKAHVYRYHKNLLTTTQYQADNEDESVMPSEDQSQELELKKCQT